MTVTKAKREKANFSLPTTEEMIKAGVHLGHKKSKWNPKMSPFILKQKNGVHLINVDKTSAKLEEALTFLVETVKAGGEILFVGTKSPVKKLIKQLAEELNMPYVTERWLGGTLTNAKTIFKRLEYFRNLEAKKSSPAEWGKYTKKERVDMEKELAKLEHKVGGLKKLEKLPAAIFIVGVKEANVAVKEALAKKVPLVAICDTNADPTEIDYPIPANDDSLSSVRLILDKVKEAINGAK